MVQTRGLFGYQQLRPEPSAWQDEKVSIVTRKDEMHWWAISNLGRLQFRSRVELNGSFWEMWSRERERRGARLLWVRRRYRFVALVQVHRDPTKREELPLRYWWFGCSCKSRFVYDLSSSVSVYESRLSSDDISFRGSFPWDPIRCYHWLRFYTDFLPV